MHISLKTGTINKRYSTAVASIDTFAVLLSLSFFTLSFRMSEAFLPAKIILIIHFWALCKGENQERKNHRINTQGTKQDWKRHIGETDTPLFVTSRVLWSPMLYQQKPRYFIRSNGNPLQSLRQKQVTGGGAAADCAHISHHNSLRTMAEGLRRRSRNPRRRRRKMVSMMKNNLAVRLLSRSSLSGW